MNESDLTVPAPVIAVAGRWDLSLVWANEVGGLTFAARQPAQSPLPQGSSSTIPTSRQPAAAKPR